MEDSSKLICELRVKGPLTATGELYLIIIPVMRFTI